MATQHVEFGDERRGKGDERERIWSANRINFGRRRERKGSVS